MARSTTTRRRFFIKKVNRPSWGTQPEPRPVADNTEVRVYGPRAPAFRRPAPPPASKWKFAIVLAVAITSLAGIWTVVRADSNFEGGQSERVSDRVAIKDSLIWRGQQRTNLSSSERPVTVEESFIAAHASYSSPVAGAQIRLASPPASSSRVVTHSTLGQIPVPRIRGTVDCGVTLGGSIELAKQINSCISNRG